MDNSHSQDTTHRNSRLSRRGGLTLAILVVFSVSSTTKGYGQISSDMETFSTAQNQFYTLPNDDDPRKGSIISPQTAVAGGVNFEFCNGERASVDLSGLAEADSNCDGIPSGAFSFSILDLEGAPIFASDLEYIGEIGEISTASDGSVSTVIVDVGGFLGMGEQSVAIEFDPSYYDVQVSAAGDYTVVIRNMVSSTIRNSEEFDG